MWKFFIILFTLFNIGNFVSNADELTDLVNIVKSMKSGGEKAYNNAVTKLAADKLWTPMDELQTCYDVECKASERVPGFKLNSALTNAENAQRYQTTTGNHLNGADSRYNYSLFEKTLKAGMSVKYSLSQRWGEQVFVFIPYTGTKAKLNISVSSDKRSFSKSDMGNGMIRLTGKVDKGNPVEINVSNEGKENVSYVIINYNSRK